MAEPSPAGGNKYWLRYAGLGSEFFAGLLACTLIGLWLDRRFGWSPWGVLVGAAVGFVGSMCNLIRHGMKMQRRADRLRREDRRQPR